MPLPPVDQSILVHGGSDDALAVVAVGAATRAGLPFAWADFADSRSQLDPTLRQALAALAAGSVIESTAVESLHEPVGLRRSVSGMIRSETLSPELRDRLDGFLQFPPLVQRLASALDPAGGHMAILLTGLQVLPERLRSATLGRRDLHESLHREGISLVATFRGAAPGNLTEPFDRVLRVEASAGGRWTDAVVGLERGPPGQPTPPDGRLLSLARELGLDRLSSPRGASGPSDTGLLR